MSRMKDFIIEMESDAQIIIDNCESVEEFCQRMQKINYMYVDSWCQEIWEEHQGIRRNESPI